MYERPYFSKRFMENTQTLHVLELYDLARIQTKRKTTTTKKETKPNQTQNKTKRNETNKQTNKQENKTGNKTKRKPSKAKKCMITDLL